MFSPFGYDDLELIDCWRCEGVGYLDDAGTTLCPRCQGGGQVLQEGLWAGFREQADIYDQVGGPEDRDGIEQ